MKKKIVYSLILALLAVFSSCSYNSFKIKPLDNGEAEITAYVGKKKAVRIPEKIRGMNVTAIGDDAFQNKGITSVTIPKGVTSIGLYAFSHNQLTSITIPNGVTSIRDGTFADNQLTSVIIPNGVTSIGGWAFSNNQLTSVSIPNNITKIGEWAFADNQLTSVSIPYGVTFIEDGVFAHNQITSVNIPNSVTSIGKLAFAYNQITDIIIPKSVTLIGDGAFVGNQLKEITIGSNVSLYVPLEILLNMGFPSLKVTKKVPTFMKAFGLDYPEFREISQWKVPNMNFDIFLDVFENSFDEFYMVNRKRAGTYVFDNGKWGE